MNRKKITKVERQQVYQKYGGHCAYCGKEIEIKDMQVDHMIPLRLGGADEMSNYMPACRQCNHYKRGNSLEGFRKMIEQIPAKLERDSYIYRVGINYGNVIPHEMPIVFYFERRWAKMTERQRELIEGMNEFCTEKCLLDADV